MPSLDKFIPEKIDAVDDFHHYQNVAKAFNECHSYQHVPSTDPENPYVMVPFQDLMDLEIANATLKSIESCNHPQDELLGVELLPDMCICGHCRALVMLGDKANEWHHATMDDLEQAIHERFKPAMDALDEINAQVNNREVGRAMSWSEGMTRAARKFHK